MKKNHFEYTNWSHSQKLCIKIPFFRERRERKNLLLMAYSLKKKRIELLQCLLKKSIFIYKKGLLMNQFHYFGIAYEV